MDRCNIDSWHFRMSSLPRRPAAANPAGGAALDQVAIATGMAGVATAVLMSGHLRLPQRQEDGPLRRLAAFSERVSGLPAWAALPLGLGGGTPARRAAGHVLGHLPAHRPGPRPRAAGQPRALPDPRRPLRRLRRRLPRARAARREARPRRDPHHARLVRPGRRRADRGLRRLRAARLPARRHVAPPLRPGRHALGPDAPDALRRRRPHAHRPGDPARRGPALPRHPDRPRRAAPSSWWPCAASA